MVYEQSAPEAPANFEAPPVGDVHMFTDSKDVNITDGEFEAAREVKTYHPGAAPIVEQPSSGGSAHLFTRASRTTISGGKFTAAGSIVTYHGPVSSVPPQGLNTGNSAAVPAPPANAAPQAPGTYTLGGNPASRPGVQDPHEANLYRDGVPEQFVYSPTVTQNSGSRVRR